MQEHTTTHVHTAACLGGNELNEITCGDASTDAVMQANPEAFMRRTVTFYSVADDRTPMLEVHTFGFSDDDALALARADTGYTDRAAAVTFRDTAHYLDTYAYLGGSEDVPNSVVPTPVTPIQRLRDAFKGA